MRRKNPSTGTPCPQTQGESLLVALVVPALSGQRVWGEKHWSGGTHAGLTARDFFVQLNQGRTYRVAGHPLFIIQNLADRGLSAAAAFRYLGLCESRNQKIGDGCFPVHRLHYRVRDI